MYSASLKPGIALGTYPERRESAGSWLDKFVSRAGATLVRKRKSSSAYFEHVTGLVRTQSEVIGSLNDADMEVAIAKLRVDLARQEHSDELVARAFAIIREMSGRTLGMRHFDVQVMGGWVIFHGMLAEMSTGEGKTLTAALPACTAALAGIPVHVVTVNDYLATRDAEIMRPLYEAFGLSVGIINEGMQTAERRTAYACDITYCTNKQLTFDYLRDRMILGRNGSGRLQLQIDKLDKDKDRHKELLLSGLYFAIVDEADSVLIDEAKTPLILSRPADTKETLSLFTDCLALAAQLRGKIDYEIDNFERSIVLTSTGRQRIDELTESMDGVWNAVRRREELITQALSAQHLFRCDKHYLVKDGKVQIVDEYTGRVMPDRSWERGLHQMIQAKEGVEISARNETLAKISYQRFFCRYLRVGGMSGTAHEVAAELSSIYDLQVVRIPDHRPCQRKPEKDRVYATAKEKWQAVIADTRQRHASGQAVLIGTRTVEQSEYVSELLSEAGLVHQVLNARQDQEEAAIIAHAGESGSITVATNMAGRGTDISLSKEVEANGGLHVIVTERHDSSRIDRQLVGRCARQGNPGSSVAILSLEDELITLFYPRTLYWSVCRSTTRGQPLPYPVGILPINTAQKLLQRRHAGIRRKLSKQDRQIDRKLAFSGRSE